MAENNEERSIFREKSIKKVTSPEELNDYIHVTSPSVWIVLAAIVLLLAGMIVWSIFGKVKKQNADGSTEDVHPIVYVTN